MILEIDGEIHNTNVESDNLRDEILITLGYKVIRCTNDEVNGNIDVVINKIKKLHMN